MALRSAAATLTALAAIVLLAPMSVAGLSTSAVQSALDAEEGWEVHKLDAKGGVDVYKKEIAGLAVPAFKGIKVMDVDSTVLFDAIIDIDHQTGLSDDIPLVESHVLKASGNTIDFWQYLDVPGWTLANDRYWFARGTIHRDVGGTAGHHKWTWEDIDPAAFPTAWDQARAIDEDAVLIGQNLGSWECIPQGPGKTKLIYRVVSDPGGKLPKSAQSLATGKTLPDNLLQFEAEAKRRAGR